MNHDSTGIMPRVRSTKLKTLNAYPNCPYCASSARSRSFIAREMMHGTQELHGYEECGGCGSLLIQCLPALNDGVYGPAYYSHAPLRNSSWVRRWVQDERTRYTLGSRSVVGRLVCHHWGQPSWA